MQRLIDRIMERAPEVFDALLWPSVLFVVAALAGLGQLIYSREPVTLRLAIGRAVSCGGMGVGAAALLLHDPETTLTALVGVAAVLGSLGTSVVENLIIRAACRWYRGGRDK